MNSTVGGPNQIAVLTGGHAQFVEQPKFPPITATGFKFRILATLGVEGSESRVGRQMGFGSFVGRDESFTLYFKDSFTRVQQRLDEAYFAGNVFRECRLLYDGGRLKFEDSNQVYDSDLILGRVDRNTPEVKHLLKDFKWRHIEGPLEAPGAK